MLFCAGRDSNPLYSLPGPNTPPFKMGLIFTGYPVCESQLSNRGWSSPTNSNFFYFISTLKFCSRHEGTYTAVYPWRMLLFRKLIALYVKEPQNSSHSLGLIELKAIVAFKILLIKEMKKLSLSCITEFATA